MNAKGSGPFFWIDEVLLVLPFSFCVEGKKRRRTSTFHERGDFRRHAALRWGQTLTMKKGSQLYVFLLRAKRSSRAVMVQRQEKIKNPLDGMVDPGLR